MGLADRIAAITRRPASARPLAAAVCGVLVVLSLVGTLHYYRAEKTSFRGLADAVARAPARDVVILGPVPLSWAGRTRVYLSWKGVRRRITIFAQGASSDSVAHEESGCVLWLTPAAPNDEELSTRALDDPSHLEPISGDASFGNVFIAWYASTSCYDDEAGFQRQLAAVSEFPFVRVTDRRKG